jgi:hypothetical protein
MVLEDHVRKGRKLIPPMLAMNAPLKETNWHVERMPEFFWIALLINRIGLKITLDLVKQMTQAIQSTISRLRNTEIAIRAYIISEHNTFSAEEKQEIVIEHGDSNWLCTLRPHIADLSSIWPDIPIGYLSFNNSLAKGSDLLDEISNVIEICSYRHEKLALHVQTIVVQTELETGHLKIANRLPIPDLNAIFDYPHTDESQHAAGFVVTTCNCLIMHRHGLIDLPFTWQRSFWNRCYNLQSCKYD